MGLGEGSLLACISQTRSPFPAREGGTKRGGGVRSARHAGRATTPPWRLLLRFTLGLQWEYLLRFPSDLAWLILRRKYDAFTTDSAYDERPSSWLGPLGWWADRRVRDFPVHVALRQRLALVTETLTAEISWRLADGDDPVRVLSAPCGLGRDLLRATEQIRPRRGEAFGRVDFHALDLDARGDVIPEARRRAAAAGVPITFHREDLFDPAGLCARAASGQTFQVINCIGLACWLSLDEVGRLARFFRQTLMTPGATLLIDNFARHEHSAMGEDLEIHTYYHPPDEFRHILVAAGLRIVRERTTANGVATLTVAEAI